MKIIRSIIFKVSLLLVLLLSMVIFLLTTAPGFYTLVKLVNLKLPGTLHVNQFQGRFIDKLQFEEITYDDDNIRYQLTNVKLRWKPIQFLWNKLSIDALTADKILLQVKKAPTTVEKTTTIEYAPPALPFELSLKRLSVKLLEIRQMEVNEQFSNIRISSVFNRGQWEIHRLGLNYGTWRFAAKGSVQAARPYTANADFNVSTLANTAMDVHSKLHLQGNMQLYTLQGKVWGPANGTINGYFKNGTDLLLTTEWTNGMWPSKPPYSLQSSAGTLSVKGTFKNLLLEANASLQTPINGHLKAQANWVDGQQLTVNTVLSSEYGEAKATFNFNELKHPKYQGELSAAHITIKNDQLTLSDLALAAKFQGDSFAAPNASANITGHYFDQLLSGELQYGNQLIHGKLSLGENQLNINGTGPYQWKLNFLLPKLELLNPALRGVQTSVSGQAIVQSAQQGNLVLKISPGIYKSSEDPEIPAINFKGGELQLDLTNNGLQGKGQFIIDAQKIVKTNFHLPKLRLDSQISSAQKLQGTLNLQVNSLDFLQGVSKDIANPQGKLNASLEANGSFKKPTLQGNLTVSQGSVFLPKLNLHLQPIQITLKSKSQHWQLGGLITESGHQLNITGEGSFSPKVTGKINLEGSNFPFMKTTEYTIDVSPKLSILIQPQSYEIKGSLLIPQADLKPISFSSTVNLSEDVVIVKKETEPRHLPVNFNMDVEIAMGQKVALNVKGLQGFLDGVIHIKQVPQGEPYATGELSVRDGKYQAYGQKLDIEQGQLIFTGGSIDNPGVRIRAVRTFTNAASKFAGSNQLFDFNPDNVQNFDFNQKTTVGIEINGRINSTKIKLFSIPPNLSQADILSMLILGRPANQASKSGGQLLLTAISSMNLDSGTKGMQLLDQIKQTLGFDFDLQNTSEYNQNTNQMSEGTSFVVGKAITSRLYLSYNIGLLQEDVNVLTLKYLLNQFFSIQVTASNTGSGVDFTYTHSKD